MLHVTPQEDNDLLKGSLGAFAPVLALAESEKDFAIQAANLMEAYGFNVVDIYDVELFEERCSHAVVAKDIVAIAKRLCKEESVVPGSFEVYESLD